MFCLGTLMYLAGVLMVVPRYLLGLNEALRPIAEWLVWYSGAPMVAGLGMALVDLLYLFDAKRLAKMRKDAWLINFGRGALIVDDDLVAAVTAKTIGGAGLGVMYPVTTTLVQNTVRPQQLGTATGALNFARQLGGAIIVAAFGTILLGGIDTGGHGLTLEMLRGGTGTAGADMASVFRWMFASCTTRVTSPTNCSPGSGQGLPSSRSACMKRAPGICCGSRSTATTWRPRSRKNAAWRPDPQATSRTVPCVINGAQRRTQADGASTSPPSPP